MSDKAHRGDFGAPPDTDPWSHTGLQEALQLICDGARELAGFDVSAISLLHSNDDYEFIAVSGGDERLAALIGRTNPRAAVEAEMLQAEKWGEFEFLPADKEGFTDLHTWTPEYRALETSDAWQAEDLLLAPLRDADGRVLGMLSVDVPLSGTRPDTETRRILNAYARQSGRLLSNALEHHRLMEQLRLSQAARAIVRNANPRDGIEVLIEQCAPLVQSGFQVDRLWVHLFSERSIEAPQVTDAHGFAVVLPKSYLQRMERWAKSSWDEQRVFVLRSGGQGPGDPELVDLLEKAGITSLMLVPLGAGEQCFGGLMMARTWNDVGWGVSELEVAMEIGRDVGQAILNARYFEQYQEMVSRLEKLDEHKRGLIATMAHEFKNPIAAIAGHTEMLTGIVDAPQALRSLTAIDRSASRMSRLVEDLLQFSRLTSPSYALDRELVELTPLVSETIELITVQATARDQTIEADLAWPSATVWGDRQQLSVLAVNLLSNAVKYSEDGGTIRVRAFAEDDHAVFSVSDDGIGISAGDQERLFEEFFRTGNPAAHRQPGTGLGLAIVDGIVKRHGGTIEVFSELGVGTTFTVRLPTTAASDA